MLEGVTGPVTCLVQCETCVMSNLLTLFFFFSSQSFGDGLFSQPSVDHDFPRYGSDFPMGWTAGSLN